MNAEKIKNDFDAIALFEKNPVWTHNSHYHKLILREIEPSAGKILEVGCGAGEFARLASKRSKEVVGIDLSENMIARAKILSEDFPNISYICSDYFQLDFPAKHFDNIVTIATAHHFSLPLFLEKAKKELKTGGKLIILDLFESESLSEKLNDFLALPLSFFLKLQHRGLAKQTAEERKAWEKHAKSDKFLTLNEIRNIASQNLPEARIKRHILWRYSLVWVK